MRVGISVITHAGQSVWENGIGQNVIFLARLLAALPAVTEVILLDCGDQGALAPEAAQVAAGFRLMSPRAATYLLDVVIEMAGGLDVQWLDQLRAMGAKVVFHCCGNPYTSLIEPTVFGTHGYAARMARCDEIWLLPMYDSFAPMLEALHRCPVREVPYLWEPCFLEARIQVLEHEHGLHFGYEPRATPELDDNPHDGERRAAGRAVPRALRATIFEPNISVNKCCTIPMLIADLAYRRNAEAVAALHVLNSVQFKEHPTFVHLVSTLDLYRAGRVVLEQRHDLAGYMSQHGDAVIAHQWHNSQNILYLDTLYGGYPLVHNSPWLGRTIGYYYPGWDTEAGAQALLDASRNHDERCAEYRAAARRFIAQFDPATRENGQAYLRRLLALGELNGSVAGRRGRGDSSSTRNEDARAQGVPA
jgi:hypothetical protein